MNEETKLRLCCDILTSTVNLSVQMFYILTHLVIKVKEPNVYQLLCHYSLTLRPLLGFIKQHPSLANNRNLISDWRFTDCLGIKYNATVNNTTFDYISKGLINNCVLTK